MKTLLIILTISLTSTIWSQLTLDSSQVSKLIIKLNEREYLLQKDSLTSIELLKKDTLIINLETINLNYKQIVTNKDLTISELRQKLGQIEQGGVKWYVWFGSGILTSTLIYIIIDIWKN